MTSQSTQFTMHYIILAIISFPSLLLLHLLFNVRWRQRRWRQRRSTPLIFGKCDNVWINCASVEMQKESHFPRESEQETDSELAGNFTYSHHVQWIFVAIVYLGFYCFGKIPFHNQCALQCAIHLTEHLKRKITIIQYTESNRNVYGRTF